MIVALIVLIPLCIVALWLFFHFSPKNRNKIKTIIVYNSVIVLIAVLFCAMYSYRTYTVMINTVDCGWWPILSILGSLFIFSIVLLIGALIRTFIFRIKRKNLKERYAEFIQSYKEVDLKFKSLPREKRWKFKSIVCLKSLLYMGMCMIIYGILFYIVVILGVCSNYAWLVNPIILILSIILFSMVLIFYPFKFMNPTKLMNILQNLEKAKNKSALY